MDTEEVDVKIDLNLLTYYPGIRKSKHNTPGQASNRWGYNQEIPVRNP